MKARLALLSVLVAATLALAPAGAGAEFGFEPGAAGFDVAIVEEDETPSELAGAHPYELRIAIGLNSTGSLSDGDLRDLRLDFPPGLLTNPIATSPCKAGQCVPADADRAVCSAAEFNAPRADRFQVTLSGESCPQETQVGTITLDSSFAGGETRTFGLFNLTPPRGAPLALGASPYGMPLRFTPHVREADSGLSFQLSNLSQTLDVGGLELALWGTPWEESHDRQRGDCLNELDPSSGFGVPTSLPILGTCTIGFPEFLEATSKSFLTLPPAPCGKPLRFGVEARAWGEPAATASAGTDANGGLGLSECGGSLTTPKLQLTTRAAGVGAGLFFTLDANPGGGFFNPKGRALPQIKRTVVSLPEGVTVNPSVASGLLGCTPAQYAEETLDPAPGQGCPDASKLGTLQVEEMLGIPKPVEGALYLATPYENPLGARIALYIVARSAERGLLAKSTGRLDPDPRTGRLLVTFDDLPRLAYTRFTLSLREGLRPMFVSPPACGSYPTEVEMHSWADTNPHPLTRGQSALPIDQGPGGGPCPVSPAPFAPGLLAGAVNPAAAAYSPFYLQMNRTDPEQEITSYSATFPPGLLAKLAGVPFCPEGAVAVARAKSAAQELASPSCPAASEIGNTLAGYGTGGILAWAPGKLYLAGPYNGAPLSALAIDSAKVGPFDLGTVVVRSAIRIDPRTAQASIDASGSDPIPHILAGVPIHLREVRVLLDHPGFTLNPTSCAPLAVASTLGGAGADLFAAADDSRATATTPFNLLECRALGFSPRFRIALRGGVKRGRYPSLRATYRPRPGEANLRSAAVTLPPAMFLAQEHLGTVCTQVQYAARRCPKGSVIGRARALTPLLDEPMEGLVYLRSSTGVLPDLVARIEGRGVSLDVVGTIDSHRGGIRARFDVLPDGPVSSFTMRLLGGERGLLANSENLCHSPQTARAAFAAHNGMRTRMRVPLEARCGRKAKGGAKRGGGR